MQNLKWASRQLVVLTLICLSSYGCSVTSYAEARAQNRQKLVYLESGMTKSQVLSVMGTEPIEIGINHDVINNPYRTEMYKSGEHSIEVLLYYTDLKSNSSVYNMRIQEDELTPLVIVDGELDGWGWLYWQDAVTKYEIRVR
jgi:hypothetical protein